MIGKIKRRRRGVRGEGEIFELSDMVGYIYNNNKHMGKVTPDIGTL